MPAVEERPAGTVTLLFTHIEGASGLLKRLGWDRYRGVLARRSELIRPVVAHHGGVEVRSRESDLVAAFRTAGAAERSAAEAQRALAVEKWPQGSAVKVRMGLHTGESVVKEGE